MTPGKPVSVAILAAWAADLATPSFGTGMPQASHASLPSGAVRLVRLSALTESRILRTASLEFDIGFLLDVNFLARRQRGGFQDHCLRTSIAHPTPAAASGPATEQPSGYGIWYARDGIVKA